MSWPRKPPPDTQCDAHTDIDYSGPSPRVIRCKNIAIETCKSVVSQAWLCSSCAESLAERNEVQRNPKLS